MRRILRALHTLQLAVAFTDLLIPAHAGVRCGSSQRMLCDERTRWCCTTWTCLVGGCSSLVLFASCEDCSSV